MKERNPTFYNYSNFLLLYNSRQHTLALIPMQTFHAHIPYPTCIAITPNTHAYHHPYTHANLPRLYTLPNMHGHPSPHTHANLPCSHTLSNTHGHPPWTLSLTTRPSLTFNTQFPRFLPHHLFSLYTTPHAPHHLFSLYTTSYAPHHLFSLYTTPHAHHHIFSL